MGGSVRIVSTVFTVGGSIGGLLLVGGLFYAAVRAAASMSTRESTDPTEVYLAERRRNLREQYELGECSLATFEDRLVVLELPGTETIMRDAVGVDGIGPRTAFKLARHVEGDVDRYRAADHETLQAVNGIGPNRASAIVARLDGIDLETARASAVESGGVQG